MKEIDDKKVELTFEKLYQIEKNTTFGNGQIIFDNGRLIYNYDMDKSSLIDVGLQRIIYDIFFENNDYIIYENNCVYYLTEEYKDYISKHK